jgi:hypothetical protein
MARTVEGLMNRGVVSALGLASLFLALVPTGALATMDLTPDAVTMATTRNLWTGDVAWLTDGRTPDEDPHALAFEWNWIGLLAVSWPDTVRLASIRVYLGKMGQYRIYGYAGGHFTEEGYRVGADTAVFGLADSVPAGSSGWYDIPCEPEFSVDNISFQVIGGATIYEMQFLGPNGTTIQPEEMTRRRSRHRDVIPFLFGLVAGYLLDEWL